MTEEQKNIGLEIMKILQLNGINNAEIKFDMCTIDIIVECNTIAKYTSLSKGRFRVFWSPTYDFKIQYLKAGRPYFDGYEVHTGGWSDSLTYADIMPTYLNDIENLKNWDKRFNRGSFQ